MKHLKVATIVIYVLVCTFMFWSICTSKKAHADEVIIYQGKAVPNSGQHEGDYTNSYGLELERPANWRASPWLPLYSLGYMNQGTLPVEPQTSIKRDMFTAQLIIPAQLTEKWRASFEFGPALADTTLTHPDGSYQDETHFVFVHGIATQYAISKNFAVVLKMQRTDWTKYTSDGWYAGLSFNPLNF